MLYKIKNLKNYKLHAIDGEIGRVKDFFFDDRHWTIRYLIADTGGWLIDRQVLISPYAFQKVLPLIRSIAVRLTQEQIENSPPLGTDRPVSRQFEESYFGYFGWPEYWIGSNIWGYSPDIVRDLEMRQKYSEIEKAWDPNLRSVHDTSGHSIEASDGEIGHVDDFIVDDQTWTIRYLVVNTGNWWSGKKVLVSPHWIERVSWSEGKVFVGLSKETIKLSPEYTESSLVDRDYETELYRHYNRRGYWIGNGTVDDSELKESGPGLPTRMKDSNKKQTRPHSVK